MRFALPCQPEGWQGEAWIEVRSLSHREALERESLGVVEEYGLDEAGRVVGVTRECDLWVMAAYDYAHSLTDFALPSERPDGDVVMVRGKDLGIEARLDLLGQMGPELARWVDEQIDRVNLRHREGRQALALAKKKCES